MAIGKYKGGSKLSSLSRKRKPAASRPATPRPRNYRKESGASLAPIEVSNMRKAIRKESGAAVSAKELRDFLKRKPRGK
tara:strand:- start:134 stop:370 length:237 start_codon:yes stop_codon:yes gene_type:complete